MTHTSFVDLLNARAPREALEQLVDDAEARGDAEAERLRRSLPEALLVHDTMVRQRQREAELSALYATANDLTAIRDVDAILQTIVGRARQLLGTDITYLGLNDEADGAAYIKVTDGAVSASFKNLRLPLGTGLLGLVAQTGVPYATPDYHDDERFSHRDYIDEAVSDESVRAILGVPLTVSGRTFGALMAANRTPRPFSPEEVALLGSFAAHAAIALENARLFAETLAANAALQVHTEAIEVAANVHDRLTEVLLGSGEVADVASALADALGAELVLLDPQGRTMAGKAVDLDVAALDDAVAESRRTGRSVPVATADGVFQVTTASARGDHLATLVVLDRDELDLIERRTLERASLVVALLLLFARTVAEAEDRVREELLDDLLADRPRDPARLRERARRQGVDLDSDTCVLVVESVLEPRRLLSPAARFAGEHGGLAGVSSGVLVLVVAANDTLRLAEDAHRRLSGHGETVTIGAAGAVRGSEQVAAAFREARQCARALVALGRTGDVADAAHVGFSRLLLGTRGPREIEEFVTTTVGAVLDYDRARGTDLTGTLEAWLDCDGSPARTARALHVHTNTVGQRLERITALLGDDWRTPARSLDLRLALGLRRLQRALP